MADGYAVDAERLNTAAKTHLIGLAQELEAAKFKVGSTASHELAFSGGENPGKLFENLQPRWEEVLHYFDRVFADNIENLTLSAQALHEVAERYKANEQAAIDGMRS
jgi:hypothetical protein